MTRPPTTAEEATIIVPAQINAHPITATALSTTVLRCGPVAGRSAVNRRWIRRNSFRS